MNIFARAWQGLDLSPTERAFLKFLYGALWTALLTGVFAAMQLLSQGHIESSKALLDAAIGGAWVTFGEAIRKYVTAHADTTQGTEQNWLNSDTLQTPIPNASLSGHSATMPTTVVREPTIHFQRPVTTPLDAT